MLSFIAVSEKFSAGKKRDRWLVSKKTDFSFLFFFFLSQFKTKKPFFLILHLPMTKAGQRKEKDCFAFDQFDEKNEK